MSTFDKIFYENSNAWPFQEAKKILNRKLNKGYVLFETGYGPSGLPHIGTFGEVVRTKYVMKALSCLAPDIQMRLFVFSDDRDALRKVPENIPNPGDMRQYIGRPVTNIPDPFGCHESFGLHNNEKLKEFLNSFGFEYEFQSATSWYNSGKYNEILVKILQNYEEILDVMLPSLREERASSYSPFLPLCPDTGKVLQSSIEEYDKQNHTITYKNVDGKFVTVSIKDGKCKLQWKVDWAARWALFGVDYEMAGKDLIDSVKLSSKICTILQGTPPDGFNYELFLDEEGRKISKSKGNGLSVDDWLKYAPCESLAQFMYLSPRSAKKLYFDVIPKQMDDYLTNLEKFPAQDEKKKLENPVWYVHYGNPPAIELTGINYSLLINLVNACNTDDENVIWGYIQKYNANAKSMPFLNSMVVSAIKYYKDFVEPNKKSYTANEAEKKILCELIEALEKIAKENGIMINDVIGDEVTSNDVIIDDGMSNDVINEAMEGKNTIDKENSDQLNAEKIQKILYDVGKKYYENELNSWFKLLYKVLLGCDEGPRMGTFIAMYGVEKIIAQLKCAC